MVLRAVRARNAYCNLRAKASSAAKNSEKRARRGRRKRNKRHGAVAEPAAPVGAIASKCVGMRAAARHSARMKARLAAPRRWNGYAFPSRSNERGGAAKRPAEQTGSVSRSETTALCSKAPKKGRQSEAKKTDLRYPPKVSERHAQRGDVPPSRGCQPAARRRRSPPRTR